MSFRRSKNVIIIICNLYDLVCWKIFCFWVKSILGNYETTLHSYFLTGDIDWYGCRWTDVYCFSIVDCRWHYSILDRNGYSIVRVSKELFHMTDTYVIDVQDPGNALDALMFVLAIDAEKCSRN